MRLFPAFRRYLAISRNSRPRAPARAGVCSFFHIHSVRSGSFFDSYRRPYQSSSILVRRAMPSQRRNVSVPRLVSSSVGTRWSPTTDSFVCLYSVATLGGIRSNTHRGKIKLQQIPFLHYSHTARPRRICNCVWLVGRHFFCHIPIAIAWYRVLHPPPSIFYYGIRSNWVADKHLFSARLGVREIAAVVTNTSIIYIPPYAKK